MQGWKKEHLKSKLISILGKGSGQNPFHPKWFTLSSPLAWIQRGSVLLWRKIIALLIEDMCLGGEETQVYVTNET